ncbi:MAG: aminomethyl transferase family protein [Candidatus Omnitrophica bacterium]|nr:aminomethyl transferase family protein [Candidatus Omnitrophota bacterium]
MPNILIEKSWARKIQTQGSDRIDFLHRILSQDIRNLKPGEGTMSAFLSAAGKILAFMSVYILPDSIILITENTNTQNVVGMLDKFLITEDVRFEEATEKFALISLMGPAAESCLKSFSAAAPNQVLAAMRIQSGFDFLVKTENAPKAIKSLLDFGKSHNLSQANLEKWETFRIESGILRYGIDMDDKIALPETGLENIASSETKGCYPGQEVVARMKTYGGHTKKMTGLIFDKKSLPEAGDKIYSRGDEIGWITSCTVSINLQKGIAFAYLKKGFFDPGLEVEIFAKGEKIPAATAALPFIS